MIRTAALQVLTASSSSTPSGPPSADGAGRARPPSGGLGTGARSPGLPGRGATGEAARGDPWAELDAAAAAGITLQQYKSQVRGRQRRLRWSMHGYAPPRHQQVRVQTCAIQCLT